MSFDRRCDFDRNPLTFSEREQSLTWETEDDDGNEVVHKLPWLYEVCGTCQGRGMHVDPNIDSNGITEDEWAEWGDEEKEAYTSGGYDVTCNECAGKRVMPIVNWEALRSNNQELADLVEDAIESVIYEQRAERMEREMGY